MKIVLILGNGFDLDLGLKTSYKDFWESEHCPKNYPAPIIYHLNQCWPNNRDSVRWYDLENELMEYYLDIANPGAVDDFITDEEKEFIKVFEPWKIEYGMYEDQIDTIQSLIDKRVILVANKVIRQLYIPYKEDIFHSPLQRDKKALQLIKEGLCSYLNSLEYEQEAKETVAYQVLQSFAIEGEGMNSVSIYSFNYTNAKRFVYSAKDLSINHMHGNCSDGKIIIGTRDDRAFVPGYDFLQKSFDPSFNPPALVADLQDADEVVIFGHSIGVNDSQYFKTFFLQQTSFKNTSRKDITIFTLDDHSEIEIKRALEMMTDWNLSTLYSLNNIQFIKTGNIQDDRQLLYDFLVKHGKEDFRTKEFIGNLLQIKEKE